jgi:hypothetical protein
MGFATGEKQQKTFLGVLRKEGGYHGRRKRQVINSRKSSEYKDLREVPVP